MPNPNSSRSPDPEELAKRLLAKDDTLWPPGNCARDRLGWLDLPTSMRPELKRIRDFEATVEQDVVVLFGMGGSSLAPLLFASVHPSPKRKLLVCDTSHPASIASAPLDQALVVVASKSGTTMETALQLAYAWDRIKDPSRFVAITDEGTPLAGLARERGFKALFLNPSDIGGRYSALSFFGLVPAALVGYDPEELLNEATTADVIEGARLGVELGEGAKEGRDKVYILTPPGYERLGTWCEQLFAESTGKQGKGLVPVPSPSFAEAPDRVKLQLSPSSATDLARVMYELEVAVAIAGSVMGLDPFDQPNVEESKENTRRALSNLPLEAGPARPAEEAASFLRSQAKQGDYVQVGAFLALEAEPELTGLRDALAERLGLPVTAGVGPRFLHSTGQLHKGGPPTVVFLQVVEKEYPPLPIPGKPYGFETVIAAQAIGDLKSLESHRRRVMQVAVEDVSELKGVLL
jgi:hypothetical protein